MCKMARLVALGVLLALLVVGCKDSGQVGKFTGEYETLAIGDAPAVLQRHYEQQKAVPGLTVYEDDGATYLLLRAGRVERPGWGVQVLAVKPPVKGEKVVQVNAVVQESAGETGIYPYALLLLSDAADLTFRARLSNRSEVPLELPGIPLVEK
jgi:hypothetical protein